jgi:hypothetical protein
MTQSHMEVQRLLRLLSEAAIKIEQDAYAAGWKDCRNAMIKAVYGTSEIPPSLPNAAYRYGSDAAAAQETGRASARANDVGFAYKRTEHVFPFALKQRARSLLEQL